MQPFKIIFRNNYKIMWGRIQRGSGHPFFGQTYGQFNTFITLNQTFSADWVNHIQSVLQLLRRHSTILMELFPVELQLLNNVMIWPLLKPSLNDSLSYTQNRCGLCVDIISSIVINSSASNSCMYRSFVAKASSQHPSSHGWMLVKTRKQHVICSGFLCGWFMQSTKIEQRATSANSCTVLAAGRTRHQWKGR